LNKDVDFRVIAEAQTATELGESLRCLAILEPIRPEPSELFAQALPLRGRALLARDPLGALTALKEGIPLLAAFPEAQLEAQMLLGRAHIFTDQFAFAEDVLRGALERAQALGNGRLVAYACYNLATLLFVTRAFDEAEQFAQQAARDPDGLAQARAKAIASWIRAGREDYAGQLRLAQQALREAQAASTKDVALEASLTHVLAAVGMNLCDEEAVTLAWQTAQSLRWTPDLRQKEFQTMRALGTAAALVGDWFNMERFLRRAIALAPTPAWEAFAHLELARLLRAGDNRSWSVELAIADEVGSAIDWQSIRGEEQEALLLFIELFAQDDPAKATRYSALLHTGPRLESRVGARTDARSEAKQQFAEGVLLKADGNAYLAAKYLRRAWEIFDRIGYAWRAAAAAFEMLDICEPDESYAWLNRANRILSVAPQSWLVERLAKRSERPVEREIRLNAGPSRVRELLAQGKTPREICQILGLSRHTVNKHIAVIKRSYGAASLHQLIAELVVSHTA